MEHLESKAGIFAWAGESQIEFVSDNKNKTLGLSSGIPDSALPSKHEEMIVIVRNLVGSGYSMIIDTLRNSVPAGAVFFAHFRTLLTKLDATQEEQGILADL